MYPTTVLRIPLASKPQARARINRRSGGVFYDKAFMDWRRLMAKTILEIVELEGMEIVQIPKSQPLEVYLNYSGVRKTADLDNLIKATLDILQDLGLLEDDSSIVRITAEKSHGPAAEGATHITIIPLSEEGK